MLKKSITLLITVCFTISISSAVAAIRHIAEQDSDPVQLINPQANTFTDLSPDLPVPQLIPDNKHHFSTPSDVAFVAFDNSNPSSAYNLKSFSAKLAAKYGDSLLVQESLNSLYEVRLLWDEVDALANEFSYDVLFSLKLDQFVEYDLYQLQKPRHNHYEKVNSDIYEKVKRVQKTKKNAPNNNYQQSTDDFITHILRKQTLYYLLALFIFFALMHRLINFLLRLFP